MLSARADMRASFLLSRFTLALSSGSCGNTTAAAAAAASAVSLCEYVDIASAVSLCEYVDIARVARVSHLVN